MKHAFDEKRIQEINTKLQSYIDMESIGIFAIIEDKVKEVIRIEYKENSILVICGTIDEKEEEIQFENNEINFKDHSTIANIIESIQNQYEDAIKVELEMSEYDFDNEEE